LLRKKGAAVAAKRAENVTNNGRIEAFVSPDYTSGALVEVSCETDFSANTGSMQEFAQHAAELLAKNALNDAAHLMTQKSLKNASLTLKDHLDELIAKIAENIKISNIARFATTGHGVINVYIHPGSTVGVMVELSAEKDVAAAREELKTLVKDICMQIAVTKPLCVRPEELDNAVVEKERSLAREQLASSNKPAQIIEKIIDGKISKFYEEVCLTKQLFIKNDKISIEQHVKDVGQKITNNLTIKRFVRFGIGR